MPIPTTTTTQPPIALNTAAQFVLAYHGLEWRRADEMLNDAEGAALLTLLCNASAKENPTFYLFKNRLLRWAIEHASDWWAAPHAYGDAYEADTVIYIQHGNQRYSFHVSSTDQHLARLLDNPPRSERGWSGVPLQPIARLLVEEWLAAHDERIPFDEATLG
jgi:hypothetical protein